MSSFTEPLIVEILQKEEGGRIVVSVQKPFFYYTELDVDIVEGIIIIPIGFETDFASIPRWAWSIFPPLGPYSKASVVHDYLCVTKPISSKDAARVFHEAMLVLNVDKVTAFLMWAAVRVFGPQFEKVRIGEKQ